MGSCRCPETAITAEDWDERFRAAKCVCKSTARLHAEENSRKIEICGDTYNSTDKVKVDGGLVSKHDACQRCDYFFGYNSNGCNSYSNNVFVELKGCDTDKAYDQIIATITMFRDHGKLPEGSLINGVIVASKVPKATGSTKLHLFKRVAGALGKVHIRNHRIKYDIKSNRIVA